MRFAMSFWACPTVLIAGVDAEHSPPVKPLLNSDLGVVKDVGVLSDLLGKRSTAGYPDDTKSLVLQRLP